MDVVSELRDKARDTKLSGPLYLLAIGLIVTLLVVMLQESSAHRQRELLFTNEAARIQQDIETAIDGRTNELRSSINFIATTHPASLDVFRSYFARTDGPEAELADDPGVILIEELDASEFAALSARERALGNLSFSILELSDSTEKLVITRTGRQMDFMGVPLVGVDVTDYRNALFPAEIPDDGYALRLIEPDSIMALLAPRPELDETQTNENLYEVFAILVAKVIDDDGGEIGWAARFWDISGLLDDPNPRGDLNVALGVDGIEQPVLTSYSSDSPLSPDESELRGVSFVRTAGLDWTIEVWAGEEFASGAGFWDQTGVLLAGAFISALAAYGAIWYERSRRQLTVAEFELAHARTLAATDPLTGLFNRQGIIDLAREVPAHRSATVFFVDLDGFKRVNDEDGHAVGDRVLREVAHRLSRIFRSTDVVGRIGGDEFVVFTPDADGRNFTDQTSKRLISAIGAVDERVTCSVGVVSRANGVQTDITELIRSADKAMYEAKRSGGAQHTVGNPT